MLRMVCLTLLGLAMIVGARAAETTVTSARADVTLSKLSSRPVPQWRPQKDGKDLRLQDFCFFEYQGKTIVASMMKDFCNQGITLARSSDLSH